MEKIEIAINAIKDKIKKYNIRTLERGRDNTENIQINRDYIKQYINLIGEKSIKIDTGMSPIKIIGSSYIDAAQIGYRYIYENDKLIINKNWPEHHLVIADSVGGGKPIILDSENGGIYGIPEPSTFYKIADSLPELLLALSELIEIVYGSYDIFNVSNEDDEIDQEFIKTLQSKALPFTGIINFPNFFDYFYG